MATIIDHKNYRTITTIEDLEAVVSAAFEAGVVAIDTETTSLDARRAELVGIALAIAPGEACYVPLGHRAPSDGGLFGAGELLPGQIALRRRARYAEAPARGAAAC